MCGVGTEERGNGLGLTYDVITKRPNVVVTISPATRVGGSEVSRDDAEDVDEGDFVVDDLGTSLLRRDGIQILMTPGVAANLMPIGNHPLDDRCVSALRIADLTFAGVVPHDEEGGRGVVPFQRIQQLRRVDIRSIIKRQSDLTPDGTVTDVDSVWDAAKLRAGDVRCAGAGWNLVSITSRTE